jgi:putative ABC transport system ATP-binding protein
VSHDPVAVLRGVSKTYPAAGEEVHALSDVSLVLRPREIVALVGRSGSGKTTLLNLLGTLDRPTSGTVSIVGVEVQSMPERDLLALRRERLGFVFQFFNLLPHLTALENAALPLWLAGRRGDDASRRARDLLEAVDLGAKAQRAAGRLSGGEMQRVAIARALAMGPSLVLADEPTGNLDEASAQTVLALLARMVRDEGATLLLATHSEAVAGTADRTVRLADGRIAESA